MNKPIQNQKKSFLNIYLYDLPKFIPMSCLVFTLLFNQNILKILKDSIVISEISPEIISFTKIYCMTPLTTILILCYTKLIHKLKIEKIFFYFTYIFLLFFIIFAFIIYPNIQTFHISTKKIQFLIQTYPYFKWYIILIGNWSYILFYSLAEIWSNLFYIIMFWQIANEITNIQEAKRFYTLFALLGNSSLIFVGIVIKYLTTTNTLLDNLLHINNNKILLSKVSIVIVTCMSILSCILMKYISKKFLIKNYKIKTYNNQKSIIENIKYIIKSQYLWFMLICSASFGLSMNLVETIWKSKIKLLYPTVSEYAKFNSKYIFWAGIAILCMNIIANKLQKYQNWIFTIITAPIIMLITGLLFFIFIMLNSTISFIEPIKIAILIGTIQNILSKSTKYSIWDTSIQMLYIPLNPELKTKGKAAVDVLSLKIGKSLSGLIQSMIFTLSPNATYTSISPFLMIIFTIVCALWIFSTKKICIEYKKIN